MWKWIVGGLLVVVALVLGLGYYGYQRISKFAAGGDSAVITIAASPTRVFASLADPDSMALWIGPQATVTASRHGMLLVGDTVHIVSTRGQGAPSGRFSWAVSEIKPGELLVMRLLSDTSDKIVATRRDSLVPVGDSTRIISTINSPMMDSIRTETVDTVGKFGKAVLDFSSKTVIGIFRMMSEDELKRLKLRVEGKPLVK
jgi:uncharacterized protein YndB with AHSA1/START domain